ncbi:MAG: hypothetical protein JSR44_02695 [Spirochaetes bacterium]|nr:hypothetical protein [Spirochaetota bacterium]
MKEILKMYVYLPLTVAFFGFAMHRLFMQSGGKAAMTAEHLNVKNIRANPTSFRSVYMPRILAGGGK